MRHYRIYGMWLFLVAYVMILPRIPLLTLLGCMFMVLVLALSFYGDHLYALLHTPHRLHLSRKQRKAFHDGATWYAIDAHTDGIRAGKALLELATERAVAVLCYDVSDYMLYFVRGYTQQSCRTSILKESTAVLLEEGRIDAMVQERQCHVSDSVLY